MTRSDLIARLAGRFPQLTAEDARLSVKAILDAMADRLAGKGRVEIRGFGSFSVHRRPPRLGRNPKTGERVPVPEKLVPHFKPGVELRERVNLTERQVALKKAGMPYVLREPVTLTRRESLRLLELIDSPPSNRISELQIGAPAGGRSM